MPEPEVLTALSVSLSAIFLSAIVFGWGLMPLLPVAGVIILSAFVFGRES